MLGLIRKIVGTKNDREIKRMRPIVERIEAEESGLEALTDDELRARSEALKERLAAGETLDDILPEAFAAVREASRRVTGMRHYDVQMIGATVLHQGRIAEMKTGEGKTLVATLALYLNALTGKGAHLITVNDYLARRDVQWMGPIYHALGVSVASIIHDASYLYDPGYLQKDYRLKSLRAVSRKEAYAADITYGTNNEFGFDYLRDNMKFELEDYVQRELHFAIVDEVDNILIDEARTPLIISGPSDEATDQYAVVNRIIPQLRRDADWTVDEKLKQVYLTDEGIAKVERMLSIANLYDPTEIDSLHHVNQGLRAHALFKKDVDYVVKDGQVVIVDEFTGRLMPGRRWSDGLHQAVEAKEGVKIERENQTLATITIQNYFRMYDKLAGMTGTADTEAVEFKKIYDLDVVVVPTNQPLARIDHADVVYRTEREKFDAVIEEIQECQERGQPVLVGTVSVEKSEKLSKLLKKSKVKHNVLNAVNHELEASVVAQAGKTGGVTIATNMAGRGTDILLGGNPEFLARAEMENEWIRQVAKIADPEGAPAARYEDKVREIRDAYEEELERLRAENEPRLLELDEARREALRGETEARQNLFAGSPFRAVRERYERAASNDLVPALGDGRMVADTYFQVKVQLEEAFLAAATSDRVRALRDELVTVRDQFTEILERWRDAAERSSAGLADRLNSARVHFDRVVTELELELLLEGEGTVRELADALENAVAHRERVEREYHEVEKPWADARQVAYERYEDERQSYTKAIDQIRERFDAEPHEFAERHEEILARYDESCRSEREAVRESGGLHIIGTERHESRRIDNQLRGRAGRQGDPGSSRFFLSLEDDLLRIFGAERIQGLMERLGMEEGVPIEHGMLSRAIGNAQSKVEGHNFDIRKHLLEYDDVMNKQREVVYERRRAFLAGEGLRDDVFAWAEEIAETRAAEILDPEAPVDGWDWKALEDLVASQFGVGIAFTEEERESLDAESVAPRVLELFREKYEAKERDYSAPVMRYLEKTLLLQTLDTLWKDHLLSMDHLRQATGLRGYGQKNPLHEYQREGYELFEAMMSRLAEEVVQRLATVQVVQKPSPGPAPGAPMPVEGVVPEAREHDQPAGSPEGGPSPEALALLERMEARRKAEQARRRTTEGAAIEPKTETIKRDGAKVGRNDPCPCGSGKKYKKCHGTA